MGSFRLFFKYVILLINVIGIIAFPLSFVTIFNVLAIIFMVIAIRLHNDMEKNRVDQ